MIIQVEEQIEDKEIDYVLKRYGVRLAARDLGLSPSYLYRALKGEHPISEDRYKELVRLLDRG